MAKNDPTPTDEPKPQSRTAQILADNPDAEVKDEAIQTGPAKDTATVDKQVMSKEGRTD